MKTNKAVVGQWLAVSGRGGNAEEITKHVKRLKLLKAIKWTLIVGWPVTVFSSVIALLLQSIAISPELVKILLIFSLTAAVIVVVAASACNIVHEDSYNYDRTTTSMFLTSAKKLQKAFGKKALGLVDFEGKLDILAFREMMVGRAEEVLKLKRIEFRQGAEKEKIKLNAMVDALPLFFAIDADEECRKAYAEAEKNLGRR